MPRTGCVFILGRVHQFDLGGHDVDSEEVVDREAVGEPGDTGVAHNLAGGGQTVRHRLVSDVSPSAPPCTQAHEIRAGRLPGDVLLRPTDEGPDA